MATTLLAPASPGASTPLSSAPSSACPPRVPAEDAAFTSLVSRARRGDASAMSRLLGEVRPYIARIAQGRSGAGASTGDLVQEASLQVWQRIDQFHGGTSARETAGMFRVWIRRIVERLGLNQVRAGAARRRCPAGRKVLALDRGAPGASSSAAGIIIPASDPTASQRCAVDEETRMIREALHSLGGGPMADVLRHRFFEGLSLLETSRRLGITYERARGLYDRGLRLLESRLGTIA